MKPIRVLPPELANQIAAGEVVERPASAVKELVENALDAGAHRIDVSITGGGRRSIVVSDDGHGIAAGDVELACERHATSKVASAADLERIETLGFRGEALPSIAAVSRLTLTTLAEGDDAGTRIELVAGRRLSVARVPFTRGTTLEVSDLFFNTPARRKFLKAVATETGHIGLVLTRAALARPDVRFSLEVNGRSQLVCPEAASVIDRIFQLFGAERAEGLFEASGKDGGVRALCYATPPDRTLATRAQQHIFVNGRPVVDRSLSHAITSAYEGLVSARRFPGVFVFLTLDLGLVDVNVHPGKHEVRFADPRFVHHLVRSALRDGLTRNRYVPSFKPVVGPAAPQQPGEAFERPTLAPMPGLPLEARAPSAPFGGESQALSAPVVPAAPPPTHGPRQPVEERPSIALKSLGQYRSSYILASDERGFLIVDQHVAHERILYERLRDSRRLADEVQRLLIPPVVTPSPEHAALLDQHRSELEEVGLEVEPFGGGSYVVKALPSTVPPGSAERFLSDVLDGLAGHSVAAEVSAPRDRMLATVACHAAVKINFPLTGEKMDYLLRELFLCDDPYRCPHGRSIVLRLDHETIERNFGRR